MERRSEQLEKEAEEIRAELADSIEQIRHRLTTSNLVAPLSVAVLGGVVGWVLLKRVSSSSSNVGTGSVGRGAVRSHSGVSRFLSPSFLLAGLGVAAAAAVLARRPVSGADRLFAEESVTKIARDAAEIDAAAASAEWRAPPPEPINVDPRTGVVALR